VAANKERQAAFDQTRFSNKWQHIFDAGWNAATKAAEARFTSTNIARDEIAALAHELEDFNSHRIVPYGRITEIVARMQQLRPLRKRWEKYGKQKS
jgi:hypothetical protein